MSEHWHPSTPHFMQRENPALFSPRWVEYGAPPASAAAGFDFAMMPYGCYPPAVPTAVALSPNACLQADAPDPAGTHSQMHLWPRTPEKYARFNGPCDAARLPDLPDEVWHRVMELLWDAHGGCDDAGRTQRLAHLRLVNKSFAKMMAATVTTLRPRHFPGPSGWERQFSQLTTLSPWGRQDGMLSRGNQETRAYPDDFVPLRTLDSLTALDLSHGGESVDDDALEQLGGMTNLLELSLEKCWFISDGGLAAVASLTGLTSLNLSECWFVTDQGLSSLQSLENLKSLNLDRCELITHVGLSSLAALSSLTELRLAWCKGVKDEALESLQLLPQLTYLDVTACRDITRAGIAALETLLCLKHLNLSKCPYVCDEAMASLRCLHSLEVLILDGCHAVSDAGVRHLEVLHDLRQLNLSGVSLLSESGVRTLGALTNLERLSLRQCSDLEDGAVKHLRTLTKLQSLDLTRCTRLTDKALPSLKDMEQLTELVLRACLGVTAHGVLWLLPMLPALTNLNLTGCRGVQRADLSHCRKDRPDLDIEL